MEEERLKHNFLPVFDKNSEILILGSFPSVKSREQNFYYGHPKNRFWRVLSGVLNCETPRTIDEKQNMLLLNHIALWDVIDTCTIKGSSDSSIRDVVVADFSGILCETQIKRIYANGATAGRLYQKYAQEKTGREIITLPSTSPANAAWTLERLIQAYRVILAESGSDDYS